MKKREILLDNSKLVRYTKKACAGTAMQWQRKPPPGTAMMREIAAWAGNFRGVCPIIGRLRKSFPQRKSLCHGQVPAFLRRYFL